MGMAEAALKHATVCSNLLDENRVAEVIAYCMAQHVEPPSCLRYFEMAHQKECMEVARVMIADYGWWIKRLKIRAVRQKLTRTRQTLA
jgi:hypothetical protein